MPIRVYIDGAVRLPEDAKVSVFDRGFLYGDSVYETIGTSYGRLFAARDHLDRLDRSASRIGLSVPPREQLVSAIAETMAAAGNPESRVRVILTRGEGKLDLDPASATDSRLVVIVFPLGWDRDTAKTALTSVPVSSPTRTSAPDSAGAASSSVMVPIAVSSASEALTGFARVAVNDSSLSSMSSGCTGTWNVSDVSPGTKVRVAAATV